MPSFLLLAELIGHALVLFQNEPPHLWRSDFVSPTVESEYLGPQPHDRQLTCCLQSTRKQRQAMRKTMTTKELVLALGMQKGTLLQSAQVSNIFDDDDDDEYTTLSGARADS